MIAPQWGVYWGHAMTISAGSRLGPYEVLAPIGAGGMGEVWRARDTRLDRDVAIKILPPGFAENDQFLQRFDREARVISSLNHPNICTLFDVGHDTGAHYLVMELIEGQSLADVLAKGPLPLDQVIRYGAQVAEALSAAHRQGIVHRDLKPGNVMLTKSGAKLLDFGLARSAADSPVKGLTEMLTQARPLTTEGTILGTFQYMAPEQLEGQEADARTDIFALGALLYEMATGKRAFQGNSKTSLIAAIVSQHPAPISSVTSVTPPALDHIVSRCLEKDPDDRWQSAHDVASELRWLSEAGSAVGLAMPFSRRKRRAAWLGWIAAAVIGAAWLVVVLTRPAEVPLRIETAVVPPDGVFVNASGGGIALNPDGRSLAFIGHRAGERGQIWVRDIGSSAVRALIGTEGASQLFWSPDGKSIAFIVDRQLRRISAEGGAAQNLAAGLDGDSGGSWTPNGDILYSAGQSIFRIGASGGTATKVVELPNRVLTNPRILPDGRRFLFTSIRGLAEADALYVGSLDGDEPRSILDGVYSNTAYASPGLILYLRDGDLQAQSVDPVTLEGRGEPTRLAAGIQYDPGSKNALFSISESGALAYVTGEGAGRTELAWVSREGADLQLVAPAAMYYTPRLSHDETRIAIDKSEAQTASGDIWIFDLPRETSTRLTYDPANESSPIWSPDDRTVIFFSEKKGQLDLYERSAAGIGSDEVLFEDATVKIPLDLSPDGRWLAYAVVPEANRENVDIWILDRESGEARPFLTTPFIESGLQFSPDGNWVAYSSNESGQFEIYVLQFPESSGKWIASRGGGVQAAWGADELYYISSSRQMMSVPVAFGTSFDSAPPVALFDVQLREGPEYRQYCVSKDGSRFLLNRMVGEGERSSITFVQNWMDQKGR